MEHGLEHRLEHGLEHILERDQRCCDLQYDLQALVLLGFLPVFPREEDLAAHPLPALRVHAGHHPPVCRRAARATLTPMRDSHRIEPRAGACVFNCVCVCVCLSVSVCVGVCVFVCVCAGGEEGLVIQLTSAFEVFRLGIVRVDRPQPILLQLVRIPLRVIHRWLEPCRRRAATGCGWLLRPTPEYRAERVRDGRGCEAQVDELHAIVDDHPPRVGSVRDELDPAGA